MNFWWPSSSSSSPSPSQSPSSSSSSWSCSCSCSCEFDDYSLLITDQFTNDLSKSAGEIVNLMDWYWNAKAHCFWGIVPQIWTKQPAEDPFLGMAPLAEKQLVLQRSFSRTSLSRQKSDFSILFLRFSHSNWLHSFLFQLSWNPNVRCQVPGGQSPAFDQLFLGILPSPEKLIIINRNDQCLMINLTS